MPHFAQIKPNGKVVNVIVAEPITINNGTVGDPHQYIQTSYNHKFRNKFAAIGDVYDRKLDMFLPPQPYPSWVLEEYIDNDIPRARWKPPVEKPTTIKTDYRWDEESTSWIEIS